MLKIVRIHKKILYLFGILATVCIFGVVLYFLAPVVFQKEIEVIDNSQEYDIIYNNSELFNTYLNEWGMWKTMNFSLEGKTYHTVKKIRIILTDTDNGVFKYMSNKSDVFASANATIGQDGVLKIGLYINPLVHEKYDINHIEKILLFPFLQQVFNPLHRNTLSTQQKFDMVISLMKNFDSQQNIPYVLSLQKK